MKTHFTSHSPEETKNFGKQLSKTLSPGLVTLESNLGGGKTKLASGILEALGAEGPYQSPTFMLMKEYHLTHESAGGIQRVYHVDAYRLEPKDFEVLGIQEWLDDKEALTILEWPEKIESLLPQKRTEIIISQVSETERILSLEKNI